MDFISSLRETFFNFNEDYLTSSMMAVALLVLGFFIILVVTKVVRKHILSFLKVNYNFAKVTGRKAPLFDLEHVLGRVLFFTLLLFLFYTCSQVAGLESLVDFFSSILEWGGRLGALVFTALLPISLALIFSYLAKKGIFWIGSKFKLDDRVGSQLDAGEAVPFSLTKSLSEIAYGLVFLYFLPEILKGIGLEKLSGPITNMFEEVVGFFPRLMAAALILFLGWFVAKILRQIFEGLMVSFGVDTLIQKVLGQGFLGNIKISKVVPTLLYAVILMLAAVEAMEKLELETITAPLQSLINSAFAGLPGVLFSIILVAISIYIGGLVAKFVSEILKDLGFDSIYSKLGLSEIKTGAKTPSDIVGFLISAVIVVMACMQALNILGLESFSKILEGLVSQTGDVAVGVFIFGIGLYIAKVVSTWVEESSGANYADFLALVSRVMIIVIAGAMALQQIGIADEIVRIAFALSMGSIALGVAIAIGLGGKGVAEEVTVKLASKFKK